MFAFRNKSSQSKQQKRNNRMHGTEPRIAKLAARLRPPFLLGLLFARRFTFLVLVTNVGCERFAIFEELSILNSLQKKELTQSRHFLLLKKSCQLSTPWIAHTLHKCHNKRNKTLTLALGDYPLTAETALFNSEEGENRRVMLLSAFTSSSSRCPTPTTQSRT